MHNSDTEAVTGQALQASAELLHPKCARPALSPDAALPSQPEPARLPALRK
jgi:hypothetical protein